MKTRRATQGQYLLPWLKVYPIGIQCPGQSSGGMRAAVDCECVFRSFELANPRPLTPCQGPFPKKEVGGTGQIGPTRGGLRAFQHATREPKGRLAGRTSPRLFFLPRPVLRR